MMSRLTLLVLLGLTLVLGLSPARAAEDKGKTLDTDPNLVGWWKFDETTGKVVADSSKHNRKGMLKGELSFDKFAQRLEQSKKAVMQKHKCTDVRFEVYIKKGKAALKAMPAR